MKLSKTTIEILKNFSRINPGLFFKQGNQLSTMSAQMHIFAKATIPDEIPIDFAIYNLNEFLGVYDLDDYDITFNENEMVLKNGNQETTYVYSSPSVVVSPGNRRVELPSEDKTFFLSKESIDKIMKVSSVLKLSDLLIDEKGITVFNSAAKGNSHQIHLDVKCNEKSKPSIIKVKTLMLIPLDYSVAISSEGLGRFTSRNEEYNIEYHIAFDS